jgi:hypothetical protein
MKGFPLILAFTAMTFLAWGAYGPTLHHGSLALERDSLRAFVGVGLAYFLVAVIIPLAIIRTSKETGSWTVGGVIYSLIAGSVGALGALGIILALGFGGETLFVMPVVFGMAPVVNTLVATTLSKTYKQINPTFVTGIITVALGAVGVLTFRPQVTSPQDAPSIQSPSHSTSQSVDSAVGPIGFVGEEKTERSSILVSTTSSEAGDEVAKQTDAESTIEEVAATARSFASILASIILAAICWGSYGPMLHLGQGKMAGSRLRPFICVGIAYFLIAVIVPFLIISARAQDSGSWTVAGMSWSFLAGVAGAIGALGVILAFNAGGKPTYVMPLIFGFAPVVNTFISLSESGTWHMVRPLFWISLGVVITGAVTVLITAPKATPPAKKPAAT